MIFKHKESYFQPENSIMSSWKQSALKLVGGKASIKTAIEIMKRGGRGAGLGQEGVTVLQEPGQANLINTN